MFGGALPRLVLLAFMEVTSSRMARPHSESYSQPYFGASENS